LIIFSTHQNLGGDNSYYITESESQKRKISELSYNTVAGPRHFAQDIAVLSLPWSTDDKELKEYFEEHCGELSYAEVKVDRTTGKSRGFGFIRFKTEEGASAALSYDHYINGRKLDLKQKKDSPMKLFIGGLPNDTEKDELREYLSKFGEITDMYVPSPFKGFGFVTYASSDVGSYVMRETHIYRGARLHLNKAEQSRAFNQKRGNKGNNDHLNVQTDSSRQTGSDPDSDLKANLLAYLLKQR